VKAAGFSLGIDATLGLLAKLPGVSRVARQVGKNLSKRGKNLTRWAKKTIKPASRRVAQLGKRVWRKTREIFSPKPKPKLGKLTSVGPGTWRSSAGVIYGQGSKHGNRVKHVLAHAVPDPSKKSHSVFVGGRKNVLPLIDEAWLKRSAPLATDPGAYVIDMGRPIGAAGEQNIKIIVRPGTSEIITAYPVH
jgi:hypothetical protein